MNLPQNEISVFLQGMCPFRKLSPVEVGRFAGAFEVIELRKGQVLYDIDDPAEKLFLCYTGNMELQRLNDNNQLQRFGVADASEFFGIEALLNGQYYETRVSALNSGVVLAISRADLFPLLDEFPEVNDFLKMLMDSYYPLLGMRLSWRQEDEMVFWSSRKHPIFLVVKLLIPVLIGIFFLALYLFLLASDFVNPVSLSIIFGVLITIVVLPIIYIYIDWTDDFFVITDRRIISRNRVILLYETKEESSLDAIQSVNKKVNSIWGALAGFGDVIIRTFTGQIVFDKIPNPDIINDFIEDVRSRRKRLHNVMDRQEKIKEMRQRLGYANETLSVSGKSAEGLPPADLSEGGFFAVINNIFQTMFQLRSVNGEEVTYRTHWLLLLKKGLLPAMIFTIILIYFVMMFFRTSFSDFGSLPLFVDALIGLIGIAALAASLYQYIDWRNDRYVVSNRLVMDLNQKPFGREDRHTAPLNSVQSVEYKRIGLFGIVFNFGTVYIRVGDTLLTFDYVANPAAVQQEISQRIESAREKERQEEIRREREAILDWIDIYHQVTHGGSTDEENRTIPGKASA